MTEQQRIDKARAIWLDIEHDRKSHQEDMLAISRGEKPSKMCVYMDRHLSTYKRTAVKDCRDCGVRMCTYCGWGHDGGYLCDECYRSKG